MRKLICFALISILSLSAFGKEDCSLSGIGLTSESDVAQRLFYTGTCHYRNEDYEKSAASWSKLADMESVNSDYQDLQIDVLNNLGYLKFFGYGIVEDKNKAIEYWLKAISLGQYESEYHLCHAYGDSDEPTYDRVKAKMHCEKAYLIYTGLEKNGESHPEILKQIKQYRQET